MAQSFLYTAEIEATQARPLDEHDVDDERVDRHLASGPLVGGQSCNGICALI